MPSRQVDIDGRRWQVYPSGFLTQSVGDEFGLIFVSGAGDARQVRVTRYAPMGVRSREQSLAELSDAQLVEYFRLSQSGDRSPEAGYHA
ncbi:MAG: hypothetical protein K2R93_08350 [Gemmatimonadaceae bacterium]|nr:hypothetical protein [Gemmatimonadaceae bacterium]